MRVNGYTYRSTVELPDDLAAALRQMPAAQEFYDTLSYTYRKEITRALNSAKKQASTAAPG